MSNIVAGLRHFVLAELAALLKHQGFGPRVRRRQELISGNTPADIWEQLGVRVGVSTNLIISANCWLI